MRNLIYLILLMIPMLSFSQEHDYVIEANGVTATLFKHKKIIINSEKSKLDRRVLLVSNQKDTLVDIRKKGKIYKEIKNFKGSKDGQLLELIVITYTEDGWRSNATSYWYYTIYFD